MDYSLSHLVPVSVPVRECWGHAFNGDYSHNDTERICGLSKKWQAFRSLEDRQAEARYHKLHDKPPLLTRIPALAQNFIEGRWMGNSWPFFVRIGDVSVYTRSMMCWIRDRLY